MTRTLAALAENAQDDLYHGDCLEVMRTLPDCSVDAVVTDPPYGLSFMGKRWDYDVPGVEVWAECLRVLKPGGHLLAFAGTRTQHRMAVNIEDAGFEIRDVIAWVYGSGFPKSLDVSKAIDKRGGNVAAFTEFRDAVKTAMQRNGVTRQRVQDALGNFMLSHYLTAGSQPAVLALRDYRIIRDTVGLGHDFDELFNDEAEREVVGQKTSGIANKDEGPRHTIGASKSVEVEVDITAPATDAAKQWDGWGTALKPAMEPITVARKPLVGTVAENVLRHGTGAINVDACRVECDDKAKFPSGVVSKTEAVFGGGSGRYADRPRGDDASPTGRWPANLIHDGSDEVVGLFPDTAPSKAGVRRNRSGMGIHDSEKGTFGKEDVFGGFKDSGSAARFFYCAKASKADRDEGCEGLEERAANSAYGDGMNTATKVRTVEQSEHGVSCDLRRNLHPTVKPTDLMRYLCRLVTPLGGTVLDPFMGSGSTGKACALEGFRFIGIEREAEYIAIARARIAFVNPDRIMEARP